MFNIHKLIEPKSPEVKKVKAEKFPHLFGKVALPVAPVVVAEESVAA